MENFNRGKIAMNNNYLDIYVDAFKSGFDNKAAIILDTENNLTYQTPAFDKLLYNIEKHNEQMPRLEWVENKIVNLFGGYIGKLISFNIKNDQLKIAKWNFAKPIPFCS